MRLSVAYCLSYALSLSNLSWRADLSAVNRGDSPTYNRQLSLNP
jgi:hypothetical protein